MIDSFAVRTLAYFRMPRFRKELANWGSERERAFYKEFHREKRRKDWLLGRLTVKELVQQYYQRQYRQILSFNQMEIATEESGKPYLIIENQSKPVPAISISHCRGLAFCALCQLVPGQTIGVDIEYIEPRPKLFAESFFTEKEIKQLSTLTEKNYIIASTALWSMKESFLKATGEGLRTDTRKIEIILSPFSWNKWQKHQIINSFPGIKKIECRAKQLKYYILSSVMIEMSEKFG